MTAIENCLSFIRIVDYLGCNRGMIKLLLFVSMQIQLDRIVATCNSLSQIFILYKCFLTI